MMIDFQDLTWGGIDGLHEVQVAHNARPLFDHD